MGLMDHIIMFCSFGACLRILFYSRQGSRFKRHLSFIAYLCVIGSGYLGFALLTQTLTAAQIPALLLPVIVVCTAFVFYFKGNVSAVIRLIITGDEKC